ncbi:hypothetical protein K7X08_027465 [Anisodus acutangulus]|uniref:Uncharacterized protein n=1 Tax=Anisodus acutangulus TaxID=402998 RepID=A0A9Q1MIY8_9SOLA|nr:hypothetical protein K7X08_027465 [Anisodus acutangulus]
MSNLLTIKVPIVINAENDNAKGHASFYETIYTLYFHGVKVAYLRSDPFDVAENSSIPLSYLVESKSIALTPEEGEIAELALNERQVVLDLKGSTRTRWRVGLVGSVKFWLHLNCQLKLPLDGKGEEGGGRAGRGGRSIYRSIPDVLDMLWLGELVSEDDSSTPGLLVSVCCVLCVAADSGGSRTSSRAVVAACSVPEEMIVSSGSIAAGCSK